MKNYELKPFEDDFDPDENIGRFVTNSLGGQQIVVLRRLQWLYLDWLEKKGGNIKEYIIACDRECRDCDLSHALEWWIYWLFQDRKAAGLPLPSWLTESGHYKSDK